MGQMSEREGKCRENEGDEVKDLRETDVNYLNGEELEQVKGLKHL